MPSTIYLSAFCRHIAKNNEFFKLIHINFNCKNILIYNIKIKQNNHHYLILIFSKPAKEKFISEILVQINKSTTY